MGYVRSYFRAFRYKIILHCSQRVVTYSVRLRDCGPSGNGWPCGYVGSLHLDRVSQYHSRGERESGKDFCHVGHESFNDKLRGSSDNCGQIDRSDGGHRNGDKTSLPDIIFDNTFLCSVGEGCTNLLIDV
jgi:hypothetical protein